MEALDIKTTWRPVEEVLPINSNHVLVTVEGLCPSPLTPENLKKWTDSGRLMGCVEKHWYDENDDRFSSYNMTVTHWQPYPDPA
ncbi:hypothetical protein KAR91_09725 [Candidatus Pacearchaeota archaeon]|nr:hypothetical protein [Candidatus Pacearchaeota archaeon]